MGDYDVDIEDKNIVGGIDRAIITFGIVFIAIIPTYCQLILKPKTMVPLLAGDAVDGRAGLKLGPGITFILTILVLLGAGYLFRDIPNGDLSAIEPGTGSSGIRSAVSDGNIWRSILLSLPMYFAALFLGLVVFLTHRAFRKKADLTQAIGIGLYAMSTLLLLIIPIGISADRLSADGAGEGVTIGLVVASFLVVLPWQIFSFSTHGFGTSRGVAAAITLICLAVIFAGLIGVGAVMSTLHPAPV